MAIITLPLPNIFTNGTTADANQVNADLNQITANVNANAAELTVLATTAGAALIGAVAATNNAGATVQAQLTNVGSATGSAYVGYTPAGTGAVAATVVVGINARLPSFFDFMTTAQIADVQARTRLLVPSGKGRETSITIRLWSRVTGTVADLGGCWGNAESASTRTATTVRTNFMKRIVACSGFLPPECWQQTL